MIQWFYVAFAIFLTSLSGSSYALSIRPAGQAEKPKEGTWEGIWNGIVYIAENFLNIVLFIIIVWVCIRIIRLAYEVLMADRLVYMRITLPRADSKLDKERETKKDFKEKMGIMTVFYKSIHNLTQSSAWNTFMNFIFHHAKISLELFFPGWAGTLLCYWI